MSHEEGSRLCYLHFTVRHIKSYLTLGTQAGVPYPVALQLAHTEGVTRVREEEGGC